MRQVTVGDYAAWRSEARRLLREGIAPRDSLWSDGAQPALFSQTEAAVSPVSDIVVPRSFLSFAERLSCHRDPARWGLLYEALWRLTHGEPHLLELVTDPLVRRLDAMDKAIRRDAHKAKAFVRFRLCHDEYGEIYIAWHNPDHRILPLVAPFFSRRFSVMRWTILTPDRSVHWDGAALHYGDGVPREGAPPEDRLEDLWRSYYRATFNPARIKINAMVKEMPRRHWATLPETSIIPDMLAEAPERVAAMIKHQEGSRHSATDFLPANDHSLAALRKAAKGCEGCDLYRHASQTVFGEGPAGASLVIVGEQPGDKEDLAGKPFVGPAGALLDRAMNDAGVERPEVYITNAVKHFKFVMKGERRMHQSPTVREIGACKPWLEKELQAIQPIGLLCLGAVAAKSLVHHGFTLKEGRGRWQSSPLAPGVMVSYHPAAILRMPDPDQREAMMKALIHDLRQMWVFIQSHPTAK